MTVENQSNQQFFEESLALISLRGEVTKAVVEELIKGLREDAIRVRVSPTIQVWRVGEILQPERKVYVFLPEGTTAEKIGDQAVDIMIDVLTRTRRLSGPQLREMNQLESTLWKEALGEG